MIYHILAAAVALWALYYVAIYAYHSYRLRDFTGPLAFPLIGNLYTAEAFQVLKYVQKLRRQYGNWFLFWGFSKPMVICTDPQGVRQVLSDPGFAKGPDYTDYFAIPFGQGLVTSIGQKHKVDRSRFATYFSKTNVAEYVTTMNKHAIRAMSSMIGEGVNDKPFNCEEFFARLTLRVFGEFCLHHDFSVDPALEKIICEVVSKGSYQIGHCITTGLPMFSFAPWYKVVMKTRNTVIKACWPLLEERRRAVANGEDVPNDPLTAMVRDNLSDEDVADHLVTLVCAGHDTTAFFSAYTTLLLAQNAESQEKLRQEIAEVVGDREEITMEDIEKMYYLRKVMQESLRIYPVIPAVSRTAMKDMRIDGRMIPKGVTVLMPVVAMHRNPDIWENPLDFNPERWPERSTFVNDPKIGYLPFGYGSRTCIGMSLAQTEAAIFFCQLFRKYRLTPQEGFRPHIIAGISLTTSNGVHVRVSAL